MIILGLEYPVLTMIACIAFITIILSSLFLFLHISIYLNRTPVLEGSAVVIEKSNYTKILVTIKHLRGDPLDLKFIDILTDVGIERIYFPWSITNSSINLISVETIGIIDNHIVLPGSTSRIAINLPGSYFASKEEYGLIIVFDKSMLTLILNATHAK